MLPGAAFINLQMEGVHIYIYIYIFKSYKYSLFLVHNIPTVGDWLKFKSDLCTLEFVLPIGSMYLDTHAPPSSTVLKIMKQT